MYKRFVILILLLKNCFSCFAQSPITFDDVIDDIVTRSPEAKKLRLEYINKHLEHENYKKGFLPTLSFSFSPIGFNRSIKLLQNATDGNYSYVEDYVNNGSTGVTISQNIAPTGGKLSLNTSLNMLTEFKESRNRFSANIIKLSYNQKLFGEYKSYKFRRILEELNHKNTYRTFCEAMATIQTSAARQYVDIYLLESKRAFLEDNIKIADTLQHIGKIKYANGSLSEEDLIQLEIQYADDCYKLQELKKDLQVKRTDFATFLGVKDLDFSFSLTDSATLRYILYDDFIERVKDYNPFFLALEGKRYKAKQQLHTELMSERFNADINVNYGMNQYANNITEAYLHPTTQEGLTFSFSIPMFNWGINRNNRIIARNNYERSMIDVENEELEFYNKLKEDIENYNTRLRLLSISKQAILLAERKYSLCIKRFCYGEASISELTDAYKEVHTSRHTHNENLRIVWESYFSIREDSLYDYLKDEPLEDTFAAYYAKEIINR